MATQSTGLQQRTRQKTAPSFPRDRQQQQPSQQQQEQQQQRQQQPTAIPSQAASGSHPTQQPYFTSSHHQAYFAPQQHNIDLEAWRLQQALQSAGLPVNTHFLPNTGTSQSRHPSRGPGTPSPAMLDSQSRVLNWENHQSSPHYRQPSGHQQHCRRKSITSTTSSSDHRPSHHHHHLRSPSRRENRSPSPGTPRTFSSSRPPRTPMPHNSTEKRGRKMTNGGVSNSSGSANSAAGGCLFETALVNSRRRIPYSVGPEPLTMVPPGQYLQRLDEKDERCLTVEIMDLYQQLLPTEDTEERRRAFIDKLAKILRREFPNSYSQVHVFGSSENRLGTNNSDVDVCVITTTKDMDNTCMLASIFHANSFEKVVCVAQAKVAVVKIWDAEYQIACDINVNNSLAIENTRLVKVYVDIDERVRPLAMIIKYWAKSRMLNDAAGGGTLTSYTWILMVINFLQTRDPPILPSLQRLPHHPRMSNGIDVGFFDDVSNLKDYGAKNTESVGQLLYAFFVKFAYEFDYNREVISVRTGGSLSKEAKGWHLMQNNSLCVEEPFNTKRNLGNTADEVTIKGLQLEFRRAVHYLADHLALDLACWPYAFPTSDNPRPERHLPNLPPHCRASSSWKKSSSSQRYTRPQNSGSPPFKSPKTRNEDPVTFVNQRNFSSFGGSRQHPYPFNPLTLNPPLPPPQHIPSTIPNTPQSSTMSSVMSPATATGDIHHAYPPTPVDQLHYIDPFKNRQVAYYIPAFAPNGVPLYLPYSDDLVYASPPQTPAMSETSLSHQPQYPRTHPYGFPQPYPSFRGQSMQRGRLPRRPEDGNGSPCVTTFPGDHHPPLGLATTTTSTSPTSSPPPYVPHLKRRNSLPPNNKPNVAHVVKNVVAEPEEVYVLSPSSVSQNLAAGGVSSVPDSDGFAGDVDHRTSEDESADATDSTDARTPRLIPTQPRLSGVIPKNDPTRSPGIVKESPTLLAGKSYAAALLNTAPSSQPPAMKSPTLTTTTKNVPVTLVTPITPIANDKDQRQNKASGTKTPVPTSSSETSPQSSKKSDLESSTPASSPLSSPIDSTKRPSFVWNQSPVNAAMLSPSDNSLTPRRSSVQSTTTSLVSPKKASRTPNGTGRKPSVMSIPEPAADVPPTPTTGKKHRKKKNLGFKKQNTVDSSTSNSSGVANHRR